MLLANGSALGTWTEAADHYLRSLESASGVRVITRGEIYRDYYNLFPAGDAVAYFEDMSGADFYISIAGNGAVQAICAAASIGLVCFGPPGLIYHRMVCPPESCVTRYRLLWPGLPIYMNRRRKCQQQ
jgi:hypothetical protein